MPNNLRLLHTSDWHLGRLLYGQKRYDEFSAFLDWLAETIERENVNILLVAGDVFDTPYPSAKAQELYYRFLKRTSCLSCCRHVVVIGGNHDSPSFLDAPKEVLHMLHVHVVGAMTENPEDEVLTLYQADGTPEAIICAVPYLRDKDIRRSEAEENIDDKNAKLLAGLKRHYADICAIASEKRRRYAEESGVRVPVVAMGHLFAAGGQTVEGDGVRDLYVGNLAHIGADIFPDVIDYVALGHLHVPQRVGGRNNVRYSGSPIPMGYGEAAQRKTVLTVSFSQDSDAPVIADIEVPRFQTLERIRGTIEDIISRIERLKQENSDAWLEIVYSGDVLVPNLREGLEKAVGGSSLKILRIHNTRVAERAFTIDEGDIPENIDEQDMFSRYLEKHGIAEQDREALRVCYAEIVRAVHEEDANAE